MAVLNYARQTIREETMYNKELMGQDRGGVSQEPGRRMTDLDGRMGVTPTSPHGSDESISESDHTIQTQV